MWIVRLALQRPYTFVVMAILILILSRLLSCVLRSISFLKSIFRSSASSGNSRACRAQEMADRIVSNTERGLTTTVNDIEHMETQAMDGRAITKVFFHPTANLQTALSQVTAISQTAVRQLPRGPLRR